MDNNEKAHSTAQFTDEEIVRYLRSGKKGMQNRIVDRLRSRFYGMVVSIVTRLGDDPEEAAPFILNDALVVLVRNIKAGIYQPDKSSLSTYFFAIAEKLEMNRLRKQQRRKPEHGLAFPFPLNLNDVEEKMNSKEVSEKVAAAIKQLDKPCQEVLMKYWLEDKSMKEISTDLDISVSNAKQRNHRCMKRLRELLQSEFKDWFKEK